MSLATGLPATGQRWSKNCKVEEVPWTLLFQSRKVISCDKGLPVTVLKQHWHDLLMIIKQFITCEGQYGFVFLHHLRLLMVFMGYQLNMPYYLHRILFKMSKKYKRNQANSNLFHFGLVKIIVVCHLGLHEDCWSNFLARNDFEDSNPPQVDKPVVTKDKFVPPVPYNILLPKPSFDFVSNLPPCLQNNPKYPGIKLPCENPGHSSKPSPEPAMPPCDQCGSWLERYYLDVPMLQSRIHSLEDQVAWLTSQKAKLQVTDKKQTMTCSILFKNVESATTVVNSKLA